MRAALAIVLAGCGGSTEPAEHVALPALSLDATAAAPDDAIVARVDGHPIYASCVAAQAAHDHVDAKTALRDCIDFELLARAAEKRGLADDPDVRDAQHAALVDRVVERGFEDHAFTPADMGPLWDKIVKRLGYKFDHAEFRGSSYVRVVLDDKSTPADEAAAHAVIDKIAAAVAGQVGLSPPDLVDIAKPIAAAAHVAIEHADTEMYTQRSLDKPYADALFALPEIGRTSPAVRSKFGWDVILFTNSVPAEHDDADATIAGLMPDARRAFFGRWIDGLGASMKLDLQEFKDRIPDDEGSAQ